MRRMSGFRDRRMLTLRSRHRPAGAPRAPGSLSGTASARRSSFQERKSPPNPGRFIPRFERAGRRDLVQPGATADGGGVADLEQAGEPQRITPARVGFAQQPPGAPPGRGDADPADGALDVPFLGDASAVLLATAEPQWALIAIWSA